MVKMKELLKRVANEARGNCRFDSVERLGGLGRRVRAGTWRVE
jgi:hypothetical protein